MQPRRARNVPYLCEQFYFITKCYIIMRWPDAYDQCTVCGTPKPL